MRHIQDSRGHVSGVFNQDVIVAQEWRAEIAVELEFVPGT